MYLTHCIPEGTYLILERQELLIVGDLVGMLPRELRLLRDVMHKLGQPGLSPALPSGT